MNKIRAISHKLAVSLLSKLQREMDQASGKGLSVYVSSAVRGEGKTFVAETLARYIAALSGYRVLLVDANLEIPKLHKRFKVELAPGFSDGIHNGEWDPALFKKTSYNELTLMTAGSYLQAGLVYRRRQIERFLEHACTQYDLIIIDGSSLSTTGSNSLAYLSSGIVLVVDSQSTKREIFTDALSELLVDPEKIVGVVLNKKPHYIPRFIYRFL